METSYGTGLELVRANFNHLRLLRKQVVFQWLTDFFCLTSGNSTLSDTFTFPLK